MLPNCTIVRLLLGCIVHTVLQSEFQPVQNTRLAPNMNVQAPNDEKKSFEFSCVFGGVRLRGAFPDTGAERMPAEVGVEALPPPKMALPDDGAGSGADRRPPPPPMPPVELPLPTPLPSPPLPNFAAIRALASSRSRVCRITYWLSDSPVNRSTPLRSSPGKPVASCNDPLDDSRDGELLPKGLVLPRSPFPGAPPDVSDPKPW